MDIGLICEFRNPAEWQRHPSDIYDEILDVLVAAEELGFGSAEVLEHHLVDDGYIPSPLVACAAIAARTKTMRLGPNIALLPLYNPVRFAEDAAVVDCISRGRLDIGVGVGYREVECAALGIDIHTRGARMDEAVQILKGLWSGKAFSFHGKFFDLDEVRIGPQPVQSGGPPLWIGGFVRAAARRVVKYGDGYTLGRADRAYYDTYVEELKAAGKDPSTARVRIAGGGFVVVSNSPEETFQRLAPHVAYWMNSYASWFEGNSQTSLWAKVTDAEGVRAGGLLNVFAPEQAIDYFNSIKALMPVETMGICLTPPGFPATAMLPHLELLATQVLPAIR